MNEDYFDEKKELAIKSIQSAMEELQRALNFIQTSRYSMHDLVGAGETHSSLKSVAPHVNAARINFEKARWACARTNEPFGRWLLSGHGKDLS